jgi:hypothetical protein
VLAKFVADPGKFAGSAWVVQPPSRSHRQNGKTAWF